MNVVPNEHFQSGYPSVFQMLGRTGTPAALWVG